MLSYEPLISTTDPLYEQAATHIRNEIVSGRLKSGDRLPPIRKYAESLGVSRLTVHRAYSILCDEGIVISHPGSGTFVAELNNRDVARQYLGKFADHGPIIGFEQICRQAQIRSFATPMPDGSLIDLQDYFAYQMMLAQESNWNLYMAEWGGELELRKAFVPWFKELGADLNPDEIVINTGSRTLDTFLHFAVDPGETILVDEPWGILLKQVLKQEGIRAIGIDPSRMSPDELTELIERENVHGVLACPHYGFMTGVGWPVALLTRLYEVAKVKGISLLLSVGIGLMHHTTRRVLPPMPKGVNAWFTISLPVLTADTMQCTALSVPPEINDLLRRPQIGQEGMSRISQLALAQYLNKNFQRHLEKCRAEFGQRSQRLYHALRAHVHPEVNVFRAEGGHGMTIRFPHKPDAPELFRNALAENVAVVPNEYICFNPENFVNLRLLFNNIKLGEIEDAAERLARAINKSVIR